MPREMDRDHDCDRGYESRSGRGRGVPDDGQGGDYEGHLDLGRRRGEIRHERAMRAHRPGPMNAAAADAPMGRASAPEA